MARHVSDELISPTARDDIHKVARLLPGSLSNFFGFECVLGDDRAIADFLVCCKAHRGALEKLAGGSPAHALPSALQRRPAWQRIQAMARECVRPDSALHRAIHNLWFEFDINGTASLLPVPNVFVGSYQLRSGGMQHDIEDTERACGWLTEMALPMLAGRLMDPDIRRQVAKCLNVLPAGAWLFQVGLMLSRDVPTTRLCARGLTSDQIVGYLERVGWPGALHRLSTLLEVLDRIVERVDLDLDVNERVLPKVGLECYCGSDGARIDALIDYLLSAKLCTRSKAGAIAMWPGVVPDDSSRSVTPEECRGAAPAGTAPHDIFVRRLHHIKLDFEAASPVRAKVYLGVHHKRGEHADRYYQPGQK